MPEIQTEVSSSIVVDVPVETAFTVFTEDMGSWWPQDHHMLQGQESHMVFEAKVGGRVFELGADGSTCQWSHVVVWEPPHRVVFTWEISPTWSIETDRANASEVEVRFTAQGSGRTRVDVEHRYLDRHGEGWQGLRDAVGSPEGWPRELASFAERVQGERVSGQA